jgi:hypothetical protein
MTSGEFATRSSPEGGDKIKALWDDIEDISQSQFHWPSQGTMLGRNTAAGCAGRGAKSRNDGGRR